MLGAFAILLAYQSIGELLSHYLNIPIPGPVIGMLLLFVSLLVFPRLLDYIQDTCRLLIGHLSLLFVPAGVGIISSAALLEGQWTALLVSIAGSSLVTLGVTAWVVQTMINKQKEAKHE
ncbi:MAG: CidA/LrgA family protein [Neisseriaceae bacterium]|nr:CidA/LrgA family protein [Neisseriaceae bacterium]MBP6861386.1 CidA/LrgA family protein [Neisseriaceae bacterium]